MEYMRKVIYLKKRENNALMQGQGFARLEKRENNLLLYLSMHDITLPGENPVYIVCRQGEEDKAFPVGTTVQSDTWNFRSLLEDLPGGLLHRQCTTIMQVTSDRTYLIEGVQQHLPF